MAIKVLGLVIVAIACAILVVLIPNTRIGEIMDKSINYMGVFAIPFILWFWEDKRTKEENQRREEKERLELENLLNKYREAAAKGLAELSQHLRYADWGDLAAWHWSREWKSYFENGSKNIISSANECDYLDGILIHIGLFKHNNRLLTTIMPDTKNLAEFKDWLYEESQKLQNGAYNDQIREYIKNNLL